MSYLYVAVELFRLFFAQLQTYFFSQQNYFPITPILQLFLSSVLEFYKAHLEPFRKYTELLIILEEA